MGTLGLAPPQGLVATSIASGAPIGGLSSGLVAYGDSAGAITSEAAFAYTAASNLLTVGGYKVTDAVAAATIVCGVTNNTVGIGANTLELVAGSAVMLMLDASGKRAYIQGIGGTVDFLVNNGSGATDAAIGWSGLTTRETLLYQDAVGSLAQRNGTAVQTFNHYGYYSSATSFTRVAIKHSTTALALSGATTVATNIIPAKVIILGVSTTVTTTITGASGYQVGDGSDADRWGDVTGTAVGTDTDYNDYTAAPIPAWNAAAQSITITAKTSDFTGGVLQIDVAYMVLEAD